MLSLKQEREQELISKIRAYISENLPLSKISDDELEEEIERITRREVAGEYCNVEQTVSIIQQVFSSIRGFGLLDSIMADESITEVMINGPGNVFIEKNGAVQKIDSEFESQRRLEDIIQRRVYDK